MKICVQCSVSGILAFKIYTCFEDPDANFVMLSQSECCFTLNINLL